MANAERQIQKSYLNNIKRIVPGSLFVSKLDAGIGLLLHPARSAQQKHIQEVIV